MRQRDKARCPWAKTELYVEYHDAEWGVLVHGDRLLFVFLIREGAYAT
jgi:DNA-3-methyladenine glycosylase I